MKYIAKLIGALVITGMLFTACNEDPMLTVLEDVSFDGAISLSPNEIVLTEADSTVQVLTVNWPAVDYFRDVPVIYSIQITTLDDAINWSKAVEMNVGVDVLSTSFTGNELNKLVVDQLGVEAGTASDLLLRVKSYVDRAAYSEPASLRVTTFEVVVNIPTLWVAGDFQGWDIGNAATIVSPTNNGIYEGYIYLPEGGTYEFKVYGQPDWEPISYGTDNDGIIYEANFTGANFIAPSAGYYLFSVDLNTLTYLLIRTEWGIIGASTPGGWDADTDMTYDESTQKWTVTADMIAAGSFKFRANKAWVLDFGIDQDGQLAYSNHPWKEYIDQPQLSVPTDGNYTVTLDLHIPGNYKYEIKKN